MKYLHILYIYVCLTTLISNAATSQDFPGKYGECIKNFIAGNYIEATKSLKEYVDNRDFENIQEEHSLKTRLGCLASWNYDFALKSEMASQADSLVSLGAKPDSAARSDWFFIKAVEEYGQNRYAEAANLLIESVELRPLTNNFEKALLATTYGFQGLVHKNLKDLESSVLYYKEAIKLDRELGRDFVLAQELFELSGTKMLINPFDESIEPGLKEAEEIFTRLNKDIYLAVINNEYGNLYMLWGDYNKALLHFRRSIEIKTRARDKTNLDLAYNNLGAIYEGMGERDSSVFYYHKAIEEVSGNERTKLSQYHYNLGSSFGKMGFNDSALHYFNQAILDLVPLLKDSVDLSCLGSFINPNLPRFLAGRATILYNNYRESGKLDYLISSIQSYNIALDQLDTLRFLYSFESKPQAVKDNRKYYALALQYAAELYERTKNPEDRDRLYMLSGRSKGLVFDEYLRVNEAREFLDINPEILKREDSLKMLKSSVLQQSIQLDPDNEKEAGQLSRYASVLFDLDESLRLLGQEIKKKNPGYYNSIHRVPGYGLKEVQENLDENELIIDYTWHENNLIIIGTGKEDFIVKRYQTEEGLRDIIGRYRKFLEGYSNLMSFNEFKQASHYLYKEFIEPIEEYIGYKTIYVIPDDSLVMLPFETLIYETSGEGRADYSTLSYLIRKNPVSYFHSTQQFVLSRRAGPISVAGLSAFAPFEDTDYEAGPMHLNKLIGSREEIKVISKYLPSKLYVSSKATEVKFRGELGKNKIIHAATHGLQADSLSMENHLLFYPGEDEDDYKFHLFELLGMKTVSPLVVLSSCNTGSGTFQPGEGLLSLARAFHFSGAKSLVMSQWLIDDEVAARIMKYFYRDITDGISLCKALQHSKLQYIQEAGKARSSPYYWASFQLTGYPDEIIIDNSRDNIILLIIGAVLLILVIILLTVRLYLRRKAK